MVHSEQGYDVLKDRGRLIVEPALKPFKPMRIPEEGTYVLDEKHKKRVSVRKMPVYVSKDPHIATLDATKVTFPLTVRRVEEGDWMQPYGMKGRKLLSDLMTDLKMTVFEKRRQLVVVDSQGVIVWAIGLRIADFVAVSDNSYWCFASLFLCLGLCRGFCKNCQIRMEKFGGLKKNAYLCTS